MWWPVKKTNKTPHYMVYIMKTILKHSRIRMLELLHSCHPRPAEGHMDTLEILCSILSLASVEKLTCILSTC